MSHDTHAQASQQPALTKGLKLVLGLVATGSVAMAGLAFTGMFRSVRDAMLPWFGTLAWTVPVGTDVGLILIATFSLVLELIGLPLWWLRWVQLLFIGLQLGINVGAAKGDPLGSAGHAVLPILFVTILEIWIFLVRRWRRRGQPRRPKTSDRDRIPFARWRADFHGTRELRRYMVLWGVQSYQDALSMLQRKLRAEAQLVEIHGPDWPTSAPADLLMMLKTKAYLNEACETIAAKAKDKDRAGKQLARTVSQAAAGHVVRSPKSIPANCCEPHNLIAAGMSVQIPESQRLARAKELHNAHFTVHQNPMGADTIRQLFGIGSAAARRLRDQITGPTGSGTPVGSGAGQRQTVGSGTPAGSGVGSLTLNGNRGPEPAPANGGG